MTDEEMDKALAEGYAIEFPNGMKMYPAKWEEVEPHNDVPNEYRIEQGTRMPWWIWNPLVRGEVTPMPVPEPGALNWGGDGLMVKATGAFFPNGSIITKADLVRAA